MSTARAVRDRLTMVSIGVVAIAGAAATFMPAAQAGTTILKVGKCSGTGTITLQIQRSDRSRLEAGFEIDHMKAGSKWRVALSHNGAVYFSGTGTVGASHSLSIDRVVPNLPGTDTFKGTFGNVASGEMCSVSGAI